VSSQSIVLDAGDQGPATNDQVRLKAMNRTRYNAAHLMTASLRHWSAALCVLLLACTLPAAAADWSQPAGQLAREIAAITGPGAATLTVRNASSLPAGEVQVIRRALETQLRAGGVRVVTANGAAEVRVTLSEDLQGYVWVAEVQQGSDTRVAMVSAARAQAAGTAARSPVMSLRKTLLWSQDAPILDVAVLPAGSEQQMLVLDPAGVTLYRSAGGQWQPVQALAIPHSAPWPRDVRGRLALRQDHLFDAYLPGVVCASSGGAPLAITCREGDDPWPLGSAQAAFFGASRNFFTGVLTPGIGKQGSVPPFFSAAALPRPAYTLWIFARTDGTVHATDGVNDLTLRGAADWGGDIVAVRTACGGGAQLLATGNGDGAAPDTVRAFEIADREPALVSAAVEFPGPLTALWPAADLHTAVAVARNLQTKKYDAFELSISCGQ
jgi:hypothetical protein